MSFRFVTLYATAMWIPFKIPLLWQIQQWSPIVFFCHLRCRALQRDKSQTHYYQVFLHVYSWNLSLLITTRITYKFKSISNGKIWKNQKKNEKINNLKTSKGLELGTFGFKGPQANCYTTLNLTDKVDTIFKCTHCWLQCKNIIQRI